MSRRALATSFAVAPLCFALSARAEPPQRAQTLFDDAKKLAVDGQYARACPLLEESLSLDPALGTMFNLADCYEHVGRTAAALKLFRRVEANAHSAAQAEREIRAHDRAALLDRRVARLVVHVAPEARVRDLAIFCDDEALPATVWGVAIPVDVGDHEVRGEAPGRRPWRATVRIPDGGPTQALNVPVLVPAAVVADAPAAPSSAATARAGAPTAAFVVGGIGIGGLAAGGIFGALAMSNRTTCPVACTGDERDRQSSAYVYGNISTVSVVAGAAALLAGAILYLTAPASQPAASARSAATR